ncbi:MAG: oligosaccharide flippase family protein [Clostridiales bacterium]|nr:oligosaccharide flippase family protein [Clostridiales bacterium]
MSKEGKYRYLAKNIGLLTLSNFATKLLSFFLVPLYTNILTTSEYGTYDLLSTTISLLIPILTLNISEALLRFTLDKNYDNNALTSVSLRYFVVSLLIIIILLIFNHLFKISLALDQYAVFFFLMFFGQNLSSMSIAYARGREFIKDLAASSVITSAVVILCNLLFLIVFKWGMNGYFMANIFGPIVQSIYLVVKTRMISGVRIGNSYKKQTKEMLLYSRPLIANSIAWWLNNVSDRYIITYFLGISENGIYSVASKIPSILNVLQSIFSQAWTQSAVKNFDAKDSDGFFSNMYCLYNAVMVIGCSAIILFDKVLAGILYAKEFYLAWRYVPWLTIAIVFGSMSGYIGGLFSAVKNSKIFAQSSVIGALCNIILNFIFTPYTGAIGAAIATTISYFVIWLIRLLHSRKYIYLQINLTRDLFSYVLLVLQSLILLIMKVTMILYAIEGMLFIFAIILYKKELCEVFKKTRKVVKR